MEFPCPLAITLPLPRLPERPAAAFAVPPPPPLFARTHAPRTALLTFLIGATDLLLRATVMVGHSLVVVVATLLHLIPASLEGGGGGGDKSVSQ